MRIRSIIPNDFPELLSLFSEFAEFEKTPEKMTNTLEQMEKESEYIKGFVAVNDQDVILGYTTYFFSYHTWVGKSMYMDDLYVRPECRGNSIGTSLIKSVIDKAKAENCNRLRWQVSDWNQPAIEFYEKLGASIDGVELNCDLNLKKFSH